VEVVASLSQGRTAAAQCGLFTHKSVPVIFEPPCIMNDLLLFSKIIEEKVETLQQVFDGKFTLNLVKSHFAEREVEYLYLGHIEKLEYPL